MTRLLEEAVATVALLSDAQQDEMARVLLPLAGYEHQPCQFTPEEHVDLDASIAAEARGEFATDAEIRAIRAKHGR